MRKSARQLVGCIALLAGMVACAQPDQTLSPLDRAAAIAFIPDSAPCAPELLEPVREKLKTFTRDDIVALLASDDPHARGVGIYLASQRRALDLLIDNPHLMDDHRESVPSAMCVALYIHPPSVTQTIVRRRYFDAVEFWFGRPGNTAEQQPALHPPKTDPWSYARPWEILVNHAQQTAPKERADHQARILNLDERLRWVVLTQALPQPGRRDLFTEDEIRAEMKRLSPATRQAILNRAAPMPPDPLLQRMAPGMHSIGEALLTDRPLPDPTEHLPPEWRDAIREGLHQDREMLERQRRESQTPRSDPP